MKRLAFLAFVLAMTTVSACGDDGGNPPIGAGSMSATIDGAAFTGSLGLTATRSGNSIIIGAVGSSGRQLTISLKDVTATGAVAIGSGSESFGQVGLSTQVWQSNLTGGTGSVNVTTLTSTHFAGTFTFTGAASTGTGATGTKTVSAGSFDVSF